MEVVIQQAEQEQAHLVRLHALDHPAQKPVAAAVIQEDVAPLDPSGRDVVERPRILDTNRSGHGYQATSPELVEQRYSLF
jgi:hypothetical protein